MNNTANTLANVKSVLLQYIVVPVVWLFMMAAMIYFLFGVVKFIWSGTNLQARKDGAQHMFWGVIGLAIMLSVFGIMHFIFGTVVTFGGNKGITNKTINEPSIDQGFGANLNTPGS